MQQALFTEPADQSGWLYHRWLVGQVSGSGGGEGAEREADAEATLRRETALLRELLEVEPNSKWCLLTLARLLQAQASSGGGDAKKEEANHLLSRLVELVRFECSVARRQLERLCARVARRSGAREGSGRCPSPQSGVTDRLSVHSDTAGCGAQDPMRKGYLMAEMARSGA